MACGYVCTNCGKCRSKEQSAGMHCIVCGADLKKEDMFCGVCGALQPLPPGKSLEQDKTQR